MKFIETNKSFHYLMREGEEGVARCYPEFHKIKQKVIHDLMCLSEKKKVKGKHSIAVKS